MSYATTRFGRSMLFITIVLLPLENHLPPVMGFSILFLIFAALAVYLFLNQPEAADRVWLHPVFITAYLFVCLTILFEFASPLSMYLDISRFALMIGGSVLIASLCRDRSALRACLYGYICAATWLSVLIFSMSYEPLQDTTANNYAEASEIRSEVFANSPLRANLNVMAFTCSQGALVAFALGILRRHSNLRITFLVIALFCMAASFMTMSRGSIAMTLATCAVILFSLGIRHGKKMLIGALFALTLFWLTPDLIWVRIMAGIEGSSSEEGRLESRFALYDAALEHLPEYFLTGVGEGNCLKEWGPKSGFVDCAWVHNTFFHITIFWGLPALLAFIFIIVQAYRCIPANPGRDALCLSVLGIAVSSLLLLPFTHNFYDKLFSLSLGLVVGSHCWIWPKGIIKAEEQQEDFIAPLSFASNSPRV